MSKPHSKSSLPCEFCGEEFRRDKIAVHVKTKHVADIAQMLLRQYATYHDRATNYSHLHAILKRLDPKNIPIYSEKWDDMYYWFGETPHLYHDEDTDKICQSESQMRAHGEFLQEILAHISLADVLQYGVAILINSQEVQAIKKKASDAEKEIQQLRKQAESLEALIQQQRETIKEFQQAMEIPFTIQSIRDELQSSKRNAFRLQKICDQYKQQIETMREEFHAEKEEYIRSKINDTNQVLAINDTLIQENRKLKDNLKKEAKRIVEKKERDEEKERKKEKKERQKRKEAKLLAKLRKRRDSSSSDDSSDSDSSSDSE